MTKEETKKAIEIMQAYVDGKQIQFKGSENNDYPWNDTDGPTWDLGEFVYRVKPEPKLRPYTFEEMCEAVKKHGTLIKTKRANYVFAISIFDNFNVFYSNTASETYKEFMEGGVWFDDGSPCGVLEE